MSVSCRTGVVSGTRWWGLIRPSGALDSCLWLLVIYIFLFPGYPQVTAAAKANQVAAKGTKSIQSFFGGKK